MGRGLVILRQAQDDTDGSLTVILRQAQDDTGGPQDDTNGFLTVILRQAQDDTNGVSPTPEGLEMTPMVPSRSSFDKLRMTRMESG
jgi:hypothetical protein